jgi:hypothetical protein
VRWSAPALLLGICACTGIIGEPSPGPAQDAAFRAPNRLRRLTAVQYRTAVEDLLGAGPAALVQPPDDAAENGYDAIGASSLSVTGRDADLYERSAQAAAGAALDANGAELVGCPLETGDAECLRAFVARFGRLALRRTLDAGEVDRLVALGTAAADLRTGAHQVIAALLQSPAFLFLVEVGTPDPDRPGLRRLTGPELATRLSFFLNGSPPGDELIAAGERGELDTADGVRTWAAHLLGSSRARLAVHRFFDEMLRLRDVATAPKDAAQFPQLTPSLREAMRQETLALIDDVAFYRDVDVLSLLDAPYTFVDGELAAFYGIAGVEGPAQVRVDLPADGARGGVLGQASFLMTHAHTSFTSPTLRGKYVREVLLCQQVPAPPSRSTSRLPEPAPGDPPRTMRERMEQHLQDPTCSGCHALMDPIGLGLENFDAAGAYRTEESGITVDASVTVPDLGTFRNARELGALLRARPDVGTCLVRNVFRQATGHVELPPEEASLERVARTFQQSGRRLLPMLEELAASEAFRYVVEDRAP